MNRHEPIIDTLLVQFMRYSAILAGGASTRMGRDKRGLRFGRRTSVEILQDVLSHTSDRTLLSLNPRQDQDPRFETVLDQIDRGPLEGLLRIMERLPADQTFFVVPVDQPFLTADLICFTWNRLGRHDAVVLSDESGPCPLTGVFRSNLKAGLEARLEAGQRRAMDFLSSIDARILGPDEMRQAGHDPRRLMNINTPDDLHQSTWLSIFMR